MKADGGFGDKTIGTGLAAIVGAKTGRFCLAHKLPLAGHTNPGAARMGVMKGCVFAGKF